MVRGGLAEGDLDFDLGEVLGGEDFLRVGFPGDLLLLQGVFVFGFAFFWGGGDFFFLILIGLVGDLKGRLNRSEEYSPDASGKVVLISLTIHWGRRQLQGD